MKKQVFTITLLALGILAVVIFWGFKEVTTETVRAKPGILKEQIFARATIVPADGVANIRTRIGGRVLKVYVREGDAVRAGTILADLESDQLKEEIMLRKAEKRALSAGVSVIEQGARKEEIEALRAEVRAAQSAFHVARERAGRTKRLFDAESGTKVAMEEAQAAAEIARSRLESAEARLKLAEEGGHPQKKRAQQERVLAAEAAVRVAQKQYERTRIVSPISGVVLTRRVDPGDTVPAIMGFETPALFEIADTSKTEVRLEVEEQEAFRLAVGQSVAFSLPGDEHVLARGEISRLGMQVTQRKVHGDPATIRADGLVRSAYAKLDHQKALNFPIGQRLEARITIEKHKAKVCLPRTAIEIRDGIAWVKIKKGLWSVEKKVRLGIADADSVEVEGLRKGVAVVINPTNERKPL